MSRNTRIEFALRGLLDAVHVPDANCSCHVRAPCTDCYNHGELRAAAAEARSALQYEIATAKGGLPEASP